MDLSLNPFLYVSEANASFMIDLKNKQLYENVRFVRHFQ